MAGLSRPKGMTERRPVVCHPEVCEGMCDEACGQTPKITRECRGDECRAEHPQLIHKVIEIATCACVCGLCVCVRCVRCCV
jgi:hypothetical protein